MGAERATSDDVLPTRDNVPPPVTVRPVPRSAPATQFPDRAALRASTIPSEGSAPSICNPIREYFTVKSCCFGNPLPFFRNRPHRRLSSTTFRIMAQQFMITAKARLFHEHRVLEFILSTSEPQSHKRINRSVPGLDKAIWERERENAVLARTFAVFSQNPEMKRHLLGTGNERLAEASPFDQMWGAGL